MTIGITQTLLTTIGWRIYDAQELFRQPPGI
jgi:hypothetical protein